MREPRRDGIGTRAEVHIMRQPEDAIAIVVDQRESRAQCEPNRDQLPAANHPSSNQHLHVKIYRIPGGILILLSLSPTPPTRQSPFLALTFSALDYIARD